MKGENVLFPMGWDAFGLPTENYAIKMKKMPQEVTKENTDMFRKQMKNLAFSFDWSREINTTDPSYYKWTQWIFIQLFNQGLAYKKEMPINWCPSCKIGLANEEVVNGNCERCGASVSRKNISQWVVKITKYADELINGLQETDFIEKVKQAQINWIGKSQGAKVKFKIKNSKEVLEVFTTRPDTLFGATFLVLAPEHELSVSLAKENKEIDNYLDKSNKKSDLERSDLGKKKSGVFSGLYAINPVNKKEIPIWIADYVLINYGTGAIMAVPAHDQRDEEFAKKYNLEILNVYNEKEKKVINSDFLNNLDKEQATNKIIEWILENKARESSVSYHLRDWIFSRQHYWGEPIPMVECSKCGWVPVEEKELPVVLPKVEHYEPTDNGQSPLSQISDWVKTSCPKCGGEAKRETDTMPNWAGSDWYFLRYADPNNDAFIADSKLMEYWGPVDVYIGGDEHNVLHLLYSRFIYKFLWEQGFVPKNISEPYQKRLSHGVILGPNNQRMSKSKGNVIVPEVVADEYGVDVLRMYLMFMGPFDATMAWNEKTLLGVKRFLDRFEKYILSQMKVNSASNEEVLLIINKLVKGIESDLESFKYNTAIAKMMESLNNLATKVIGKDEIQTLIKLIAPFAPYLAEELWEKIDNNESVHISSWPVVDNRYLEEKEITIAVAINGKVRDQLIVEAIMSENKKEITERAKKAPKIVQWLNGKTIENEIYIKGKMINFVVNK
jgi:leucyl-tRNA synthetase